MASEDRTALLQEAEACELLLLNVDDKEAGILRTIMCLRNLSAALSASPARPIDEVAALRAEIRTWAVYCFTKYGSDAVLYNGLADLAGMAASPAPRPETKGPRRKFTFDDWCEPCVTAQWCSFKGGCLAERELPSVWPDAAPEAREIP